MTIIYIYIHILRTYANYTHIKRRNIEKNISKHPKPSIFIYIEHRKIH